MRKFRKILSISMVLAILFTLLPVFPANVFAAAPDEPTTGVGILYANGQHITIEDGTAQGTTKVSYMKDGQKKYVNFGNSGNTEYEKDLSGYTIYGGARGASVEESNITMTGGQVEFIQGGGLFGSVKNANITIEGGTVIKNIWGGENNDNSQFPSHPLDGHAENVTINVSGGTIKNIFGGGSTKSNVKNVVINVTGGEVSVVYGGGDTTCNVESAVINITGGKIKEAVLGGGKAETQNATIKIKENAQVNEVYGGGQNTEGRFTGNAKIEISGSANVKNVYAGGYCVPNRGQKNTFNGNAEITVSENATIETIYGGGENDSVMTGNSTITLNGGTVSQNIYAGGNKTSNVEGNVNIHILEGATVTGTVLATGIDSTVTGEKNAVIEAPSKFDVTDFTNFIGQSQENNWTVKGMRTLAQGKSIEIAENKSFTILENSTLSLEGMLTNNGTLEVRSENGLTGNGTLAGEGKYLGASDSLTDSDITLEEDNSAYTGEEIMPVAHINKKSTILGKEFRITNWKSAGVTPSPAINVGDYSLIVKRENSDSQIQKPFRIIPAMQGGKIRLTIEDKNQDNRPNAGDVLSVDRSGLLPKGGTPNYSWKKITGNSEKEIAITESYTLTDSDGGAKIYCEVTFTGNTFGALQTDRTTSKLPAPVIVFPTASTVRHGEKLKNSKLIGGSTEYGSFAWADENTIPAPGNRGYDVVFTPNQDTLEKYAPITNPIQKVVVAVNTEPLLPYIPSTEKEEATPQIEKPKNPSFVDVNPNDYFAEAVNWAIENGIVLPNSENVFSPYHVCNRAEIVTFLWKAAKSPKAGTELSSFTDVPAKQEPSEAIQWASKKGIAEGMALHQFRPEAIATRAQVITMLYRFADSPQVTENRMFEDVAAGAYYEKAVIWATQKGITQGIGMNLFSPNMECNKAQAMTFLYRLFQLENQKKK